MRRAGAGLRARSPTAGPRTTTEAGRAGTRDGSAKVQLQDQRSEYSGSFLVSSATRYAATGDGCCSGLGEEDSLLRCLVTGAAGFVGSHLIEELLKQGADVVANDCFTKFYPRWIKELNVHSSIGHPRCSFIEGDLTELDLSELLVGVDYVFHQAAQAGVRTSWGPGF